eukprot:TRINITY_DN10369_c0_g1_i1.p1 TRINITY_DN10369_c0_g1~~TRINITY_DN10369_c0_g1_i1.p1  ORF type:complete len:486 (+),score=124.27 TRINITY_DN10369_c0_g1_i1:1540-2997(+)
MKLVTRLFLLLTFILYYVQGDHSITSLYQPITDYVRDATRGSCTTTESYGSTRYQKFQYSLADSLGTDQYFAYINKIDMILNPSSFSGQCSLKLYDGTNAQVATSNVVTSIANSPSYTSFVFSGTNIVKLEENTYYTWALSCIVTSGDVGVDKCCISGNTFQALTGVGGSRITTSCPVDYPYRFYNNRIYIWFEACLTPILSPNNGPAPCVYSNIPCSSTGPSTFNCGACPSPLTYGDGADPSYGGTACDYPPTAAPTKAPTASPTAAPTVAPTPPVAAPTSVPVTPTAAPVAPTAAPVTPTAAPVAPTTAPVTPTAAPVTPVTPPSASPTDAPTSAPVTPPTPTPTAAPVVSPTSAPVVAPVPPSAAPSDPPSNTPTNTPTDAPTATPTDTPTDAPTETPTNAQPVAPPPTEETDAPTVPYPKATRPPTEPSNSTSENSSIFGEGAYATATGVMVAISVLFAILMIGGTVLYLYRDRLFPVRNQ